MSGLSKEELMALWMTTDPVARSPYAITGHKPMWKTLTDGRLTLFSSPGIAMTQDRVLGPWVEVEGVSYQWQRDDEWVGQGHTTTFEDFELHGPSKMSIPREKLFDETKAFRRTGDRVEILPFIEGLPSPEKSKAITSWVKRNADLYANKMVRLYHATDPSLPIDEQGLKATSLSRRRSYQSESGYVYLANTPERAKAFGDMGNGGKSVVYEVLVFVRNLLPDRDQLNNQRAVGVQVGNTIGDSIVYGGGARVKGHIEPWAVYKLSDDEYQLINERNHRIWAFETNLAYIGDVAKLLLTHGLKAIERADGNPYRVQWDEVVETTIVEAIKEGLNANEIYDIITDFSPSAITREQQQEVSAFLKSHLVAREPQLQLG